MIALCAGCGRAHRHLQAQGGGRRVRLLGLILAVATVLLASATAADASTFKWSGDAAASNIGWSNANNWVGNSAPSGTVNLEFPHLSRTACNSEPPTEACYESEDDVSGLTAESLRIDDSGFYELEGSAPLTLGSGGLTSEPETSTPGYAALFTPITLGSSQTWKLAGTSRSEIEHNLFVLEDELKGSGSSLTVDVSNGIALLIGANAQVGPLSIVGAEATGERVKNAVVGIGGGGAINSTDGEPVNLAHVYFFGSGQLGALHTEATTLEVGSGTATAGELETTSVTLDSATTVGFEVHGTSPTPGVDYAELRSTGPVALGSATVAMLVPQLKAKEICHAPPVGQTYTLVSTTGELTGSFANAPEGTQIPITYLSGCGTMPLETLQIEYHRSGLTKTVTGRVVAGYTSTTTLESSVANPVTNQGVTLTAPVQSSGEAPEGTVAFYDKGKPIAGCGSRLVGFGGAGPHATCSTSFVAAGSPESLSAVYTPGIDVDVEGSSTTSADELHVGRGPATVGVRPSTTRPSVGQAVTYTVAVTPEYSGAVQPSGVVEFKEGGVPIGSCSAQALVQGPSPTATCVLSYTSLGEHVVTANYLGDVNFVASSGSGEVTVQEPEAPSSSSVTKSVEEHAQKSVEEPAQPKPGNVTLDGITLKVGNKKDAVAKLGCEGEGSCTGKLTLSARETVTKKGKKSSRTVTIGTATFSLTAGKTASFTVQINATGRGLLTGAHGHLAAHLQVAEQAPGATFSKEVHLLADKAKKG